MLHGLWVIFFEVFWGSRERQLSAVENLILYDNLPFSTGALQFSKCVDAGPKPVCYVPESYSPPLFVFALRGSAFTLCLKVV